MFGETAGIRIALNTNSPSTSTTAWKTATVSMNSGTSSYLQGQSLGSSRMSQLAMIETVGLRSLPTASLPWASTGATGPRMPRPIHSLLSDQFDSTDSTNSEVQQLNLLNAAEAQKLSEMQAQGTLHTCLAGQMTVANMERRNAAVEDLNTAVFVQQQRAANDTSAANESNTWQTYLP